MFTHSTTTTTTKVSNEHVNSIVKSILNKRQKNLVEQQKIFIQKNTDENNKRNNYLVEKFIMKKPTNSSKENINTTTKKKLPIQIDDDDDDDDFISTKKSLKIINQSKENLIDSIKECLESIIIQIENNDAICPICNEILSNLNNINQREQHVNQCLEKSQFNQLKQQKTLLNYSNFFTTNHQLNRIKSFNFKCQICGISFNNKRTYLMHLKKCSNQNSIQLKHVVNFVANTTTTTINELKPATTNTIPKKKPEIKIKNRIIKMEIPKTEDDEQQQLAIALSTSIKTATEIPNAFDILQQVSSKKTKTIDLLTTPLWNVSNEDKLKLLSRRLSNICERLITTPRNSYKFPPSSLLLFSRTNFGHVNWWNITTTDPHDDEIPMTQLVRILDDEEPVI